ncbi:hypothetical protein EG329_000233 [Mollisiaceae sp. DMI_Dod_QoI]|nr:hypothetical protein EG329_000233 [Helotiales sp. DMI_Dod_QoI]
MANEVNMNIMEELGRHSAYDELWIICGEEQSTTETEGMWGRVELFTSRQSSLGKYFRGREITLDPSSPDNFVDIKAWLEVCSNHQKCEKLLSRPLPKRILDVGLPGSQTVRLKVTEGQMGTYVALSYCWGRSPALVTTIDTLDDNLQGISLANLPATLEHAVYVTRELGFQYLWIDALCIIQARSAGDQPAIADWQDQASKMADIYGNAFLTIAATGAADKFQGCFLSWSATKYTCKIALNDDADSSIVSARPLVNSSIYQRNLLDDRAWTFQEGVLSQRLLLYGENEISFVCRTGRQAERLGKGDIPLPRNGIKVRGPQIFPTSTKNDEERDGVIVNWSRILEHDFCGRSITNESDILPALSGVAHRFQMSLGGRYYAGLWEVDIVRGLLWKCKNIVPQGKGVYLKPRAIYCAPSWSWAVLHGSIMYGFTSHHKRRWEKAKELNLCPVEVLDIQTTLVGPSYDPMGQVSGGFIRIKAPVRRVVVSKSINKFRREYTSSDGSKWMSSHSPLGNNHLLVGEEAEVSSDPQAVGALGHFDTEHGAENILSLTCLFLWPNGGLMLVINSSTGENAKKCFKRVGAFTVYRSDWVEGAQQICVTII